jgi:hypothetical protein
MFRATNNLTEITMKSFKLICLGILFLFSSCEIFNLPPVSDIDKLLSKNKQKITITTGLSGTLLKKEGDCMPSYPTTNKSCKEYPVSRTLSVYEYSTIRDVVGYGPLFDSVTSKLIGQCKADNDGFFQITLSPGKYSIFILENEKFYANGFDGLGGINPVVVKADNVSIIRLTLDYASY